MLPEGFKDFGEGSLRREGFRAEADPEAVFEHGHGLLFDSFAVAEVVDEHALADADLLGQLIEA